MKISTILSLGVLLVFMGGCESGPDSEEGEPVTAIAGYELAPMDLSRVVQASATVEAENVVTIASRMDGLITLLNAREGDSVEPGHKLIEFDIEQQQAELERAQAEMELAEAVFESTLQFLYSIYKAKTCAHNSLFNYETRDQKRGKSEIGLGINPGYG